ncbi:MAG: hypothetical protein U0528_04410 [Anaerolineae bacterium]
MYLPPISSSRNKDEVGEHRFDANLSAVELITKDAFELHAAFRCHAHRSPQSAAGDPAFRGHHG